MYPYVGDAGTLRPPYEAQGLTPKRQKLLAAYFRFRDGWCPPLCYAPWLCHYNHGTPDANNLRSTPEIPLKVRTIIRTDV